MEKKNQWYLNKNIKKKNEQKIASTLVTFWDENYITNVSYMFLDIF